MVTSLMTSLVMSTAGFLAYTPMSIAYKSFGCFNNIAFHSAAQSAVFPEKVPMGSSCGRGMLRHWESQWAENAGISTFPTD